MKVSINLNDKVKVRVKSPAGYLAWQQCYQRLDLPVPALSAMADARGYHTFQLHEVMTFFGHAMCNGIECPIETEFEVIERD